MKLRCIFWAAIAGVCFAQDESIKVDVNVVNVLSTVTDRRGALVTDLNRSDFEVLENGRRQQIRYFARETDLPLTIALLVDLSGSVRTVIDQEKDAAGKFFEAVLRPTDQAMLLGFSSTLVLWQNFTPSVESLKEALGRMHAVPFKGLPGLDQPMPGTLLYDAIYQTANTKLIDVQGRKVMVIVSDGLDNGSVMHINEAIDSIQGTNAVVYGICYESGFSGCEFLRQIAEPTGGRVFSMGKKASLVHIFASIEDELRSQYALGYVPENAVRDGSFRRLQVKVTRKDLKVRARKGYFALREAAK
jgi:VWFA-related protein